MRAKGDAVTKAMAIPAIAVVETIAFATAQPANTDVGETVIRPTAKG